MYSLAIFMKYFLKKIIFQDSRWFSYNILNNKPDDRVGTVQKIGEHNLLNLIQCNLNSRVKNEKRQNSRNSRKVGKSMRLKRYSCFLSSACLVVVVWQYARNFAAKFARQCAGH